MYKKISGLIQTYGILNVATQIIEKARKSNHPSDDSYGDNGFSDDLTNYNDVRYECQETSLGRSISVILVIHKFFPDSCGGTEQFTRHLAKQLKEIGYKVAICTYSEYRQESYSGKEAAVLWKEDTIDEIPVIYFRLNKPNHNLFKDIERCGKDYVPFLKYLQSRFQPDVFHFTHLSRVSGLAQCCRQNHIPYVVTLTDFYAFCHYSTYIQKDGHFCHGSQQGKLCTQKCQCHTACQNDRYENSRAILTFALSVAVPSQFMLRIVKNEMPEVSIMVIPHSVKQAIKTVNCKPGGHGGKFLYVGHLSEDKGVYTLVKAFEQMPDTCTLTIYGDGRPDFVRRLKKKYDSDKRITFAGQAEHEVIEQAYLDADYVVIPSEVPETYSMVLHEALAYGKFVVASRIGAIPEAIIEGENGFLFEPGNGNELYKKMKMAIGSENTMMTSFDSDFESYAYSEIYERGIDCKWRTPSGN